MALATCTRHLALLCTDWWLELWTSRSAGKARGKTARTQLATKGRRGTHSRGAERHSAHPNPHLASCLSSLMPFGVGSSGGPGRLLRVPVAAKIGERVEWRRPSPKGAEALPRATSRGLFLCRGQGWFVCPPAWTPFSVLSSVRTAVAAGRQDALLTTVMAKCLPH